MTSFLFSSGDAALGPRRRRAKSKGLDDAILELYAVETFEQCTD